MVSIRAFIAVEIALAVRNRACDMVERLRMTGVKSTWTKPERMHLTLKFLGDTEESQIPRIREAIEDAVKDVEPFRLHFVGAGAFPNTLRPSTVWLGVREGEESVIRLAERIDKALRPLRIPRERRAFRPHLTIARIRGGARSALEDLGRRIEANSDFDAGSTQVTEAVFFSSLLQPTGPFYQVLARAPFVARETEA